MSDPDNDQTADLVRIAGPPNARAADRSSHVRAAVHPRGQQQTHARSRKRVVLTTAATLALAATIVVGIRVAQLFNAPVGMPDVAVATVESVAGNVLLLPFGRRATPRPAAVGGRLTLGEVVDTSVSGGASIRLTTGLSVRVDARSRLRVLSDSTLVLDEGGVYIDSGVTGGRGGLEVRTMHGTARDIGTKFEVRVTTSAMRVRVRDGLVQVQGNRASHDTNPGEELTLDSEGQVTRRRYAIHGATWEWAAALARPFEIEGRSLHEFLAWIARENGWRVTFSSPGLEQRAVTTILRGSIQGALPRDALDSVLPTRGLTYRLDEGILLVRPQDGAARD